MTIDVGTGHGRAVLDVAAREPLTFALGLDANAAAMAEASRRAAGPARKGGRPNARFLLASAETPPMALAGIADLVTVRFPWGSLLRGCLGLDGRVAAGVASLVAADGALELLLAPSARDGLEGVPVEGAAIVKAAACAFAPHGLALDEGRAATEQEISTSGSTWAKRLGGRAVTFVRLVRRARR